MILLQGFNILIFGEIKIFHDSAAFGVYYILLQHNHVGAASKGYLSLVRGDGS